MKVIELTDVNGERVMIGFPDERPFVIRIHGQGDAAHTFITFGGLWACVKESPCEVLALFESEDAP